MRLLAILFLGGVLCQAAQAGLQWERQVVQLRAEADQPEVVADFPFKNTGDHPVTIVSMDSSCGCTVASLEKKSYAPGQVGVLRATFTVGGRTGVQSKVITVRTDGQKDEPIQLVITVELLDPPTITPRFLYWRAGERKAAKALVVKAPEGQICHVKSIGLEDKAFSAQVKTIAAGKEYTILVTPRDTRKAVNAVMEVKTDWPSENPKSYKVYLRVLPKGTKDASPEAN